MSAFLRRLLGGHERSVCACVSKGWLMRLSSIHGDEICTTATTHFVEPENRSESQNANQVAQLKEKGEFGDLNEIKPEHEKFQEADSHGYLFRCLEEKKASDVRLAVISIGTASHGGHTLTKANFQALNISDGSLTVIGYYGSAMIDLALGGLHSVNERCFWVMAKGQGLQKVEIIINSFLQRRSSVGLEALGNGCPNLKVFDLHKYALVSDSGVVSFSKAVGALQSLRLEDCHRITQFGVLGILANCVEN
ncbi:UNVERIFIED_CONTAM: EIN3-binding F-box protein 1 [Sesamum radiatum]|uniref:EIN3-binding F-box protein 1 n=1 Tax=Sesamum radiatum TaxID=300843 RepID=A0AAW2U8W5_SESRA